MTSTVESPNSSSSSADSYIGSLISLTSKSEIRYEGVLYSINTEESSIGLRNVRSFGTEGRKKDGPQVPHGDKVYEYILFRGSDIKDLQVKSSPPVQTAAPINNDPAIIQSHYPYPAAVPTSLPSSLPSATTGSMPEISSLTVQPGLPAPNFQGSMPLYQPGGNLGPWGPSPPQLGSNGNGLAMPMNTMYWPGYYGPPNGMPSLQQQSLLRPPTGLSMPPSMQHPMQYPGFNNPLSSGPLNFSNSSLPELPSSLLPSSNTTVNMSSTLVLPSALPRVPSATQASESISTRAPISASVSSNMSSFAPLTTSSPDVNIIVPPIVNKLNATPGMNFTYPTMSQSASPIIGTANLSTAEAPTPSLVTPGQLSQSTPTLISSSQGLQTAHKDVEVVEVSSKSTQSSVQAPVLKEAQPPILPLPTPSRSVPKVNGTPFQARNGYRGRERGRGMGMGGPRPVMKFTEEFDFIAMNEKFNKDEVWGNLGKSNKSNSRDEKFSDENYYQGEEEAESSVKTVYNKDDFFDSLSSNALDQESRNGRPRFSEQMKMDTETFGEFSRYRGGSRGGRGFNYNRGGGGGRYRGGYNDRGGYGYNGRGRGRGGYANYSN